MSQLTANSYQPATLYLNGRAIGTANVSWPEPAPPEPIQLSATHTADFILNYPPGKKGRRQRQQFCNLLWDTQTLALARHYARVKHHQLRKRLRSKRN